MKRTSFSFSLTQATGPRDARDAVNSENPSQQATLKFSFGILTREGRNILNLRLEAHLDRFMQETHTEDLKGA